VPPPPTFGLLLSVKCRRCKRDRDLGELDGVQRLSTQGAIVVEADDPCACGERVVLIRVRIG
jgi:hypothetical protein